MPLYAELNEELNVILQIKSVDDAVITELQENNNRKLQYLRAVEFTEKPKINETLQAIEQDGWIIERTRVIPNYVIRDLNSAEVEEYLDKTTIQESLPIYNKLIEGTANNREIQSILAVLLKKEIKRNV